MKIIIKYTVFAAIMVLTINGIYILADLLFNYKIYSGILDGVLLLNDENYSHLLYSTLIPYMGYIISILLWNVMLIFIIEILFKKNQKFNTYSTITIATAIQLLCVEFLFKISATGPILQVSYLENLYKLFIFILLPVILYYSHLIGAYKQSKSA
jgi:hypothetical protein